MNITFRLFCLLIGYAFGCLQFAYIIGRIFGRIDIREHGSGNAGTTNAIRVMGKKAGAAVFFLDILKCTAAFVLCTVIFGGTCSFFDMPADGIDYLPGLYGGLGTVLGHNFPVFMKFKGGKGIAASIGLLLALDFRIAGIAYLAGILAILLTRYMSALSLAVLGVFAVTVPFFGFVLNVPGFTLEIVLICFLLTALAYFQHRGNIVRLIKGTEPKFSLRRKR